MCCLQSVREKEKVEKNIASGTTRLETRSRKNSLLSWNIMDVMMRESDAWDYEHSIRGPRYDLKVDIGMNKKDSVKRSGGYLPKLSNFCLILST